MINLAKLFKDYNNAGTLNEYINLYGFAGDQSFSLNLVISGLWSTLMVSIMSVLTKTLSVLP